MSKKHECAWLGIETTGLDPREGSILEWSLVFARDARGGDLSIVHEVSQVVRYVGDPWTLSTAVRAMHSHNGLLAECAASTTTIEESDDFMAEILSIMSPERARAHTVLAAYSAEFTLRWVRHHLPKFAAQLSPWALDVGGLFRATKMWAPPIPSPVALQTRDHRAGSNVRHALARAAHWRALVGW